MDKGACFSEDGQYRYKLWRQVPLSEDKTDKGTVVFVMLNPSTADADKDDPTIRRCMTFAKEWGYGRLEVVNLFAYRSPHPSDLAQATGKNITGGTRNNDVIKETVQEADRVVCAWGAASSTPANFKKEALKNRSRKVLESIKKQRKTPYRLGSLTNNGNPRHPLPLRGDTKPQPWN